MIKIAAALLIGATTVAADKQVDYAGDAKALDKMIADDYGYEEHWPGGTLPDSKILQTERDAVHDEDSLLHYAEHRIASLADHHAITGSSFHDSWAIVPTYADLWIVIRDGRYLVDAVRDDSPAAKAGIAVGDELTAIDGQAVAGAVAAYWRALGLHASGERLDVGARVLAAGRRDRSRHLTFARNGKSKSYDLPSLYTLHDTPDGLVSASRDGTDSAVIRFNNSLGEQESIAAFDKAMTDIPETSPVTIDLRDTPSGGNTSVARAVMGWFVKRPTSYQVHVLPAEERETGIAREWIEQVLPRTGKYHSGPVKVLVGRWTGSMGEGLAIGLKAIGAQVCGDRMAGLKGAVYDLPLPSSGLVVKIPVERLYAVWGQPREDFVPDRCK